jgi:uncharacterized membrane protein YphA (DoxX/SURF4 family)
MILMVSLFPTLFDYNAVATAVLRIIIALVFITQAYGNLPKKWVVSTTLQKLTPLIEMVLGVFLFFGIFTQAVAIIFSLVSLKMIFVEYQKPSNKFITFPILLFFVSFSLLFLGPGIWSIDYPL